jgi:hypothetical protein
MTGDDFLVLADRVIQGPLDERVLEMEGRFPRGVATRIESALRKYAVANLFQTADVLPSDTEAEAKAKVDAARAANAKVIQELLSD